jgi:hypothetical protein
MPDQLIPYLTQDTYNYLMGFSGLVCGAIVWMIFSKGI